MEVEGDAVGDLAEGGCVGVDVTWVETCEVRREEYGGGLVGCAVRTWGVRRACWSIAVRDGEVWVLVAAVEGLTVLHWLHVSGEIRSPNLRKQLLKGEVESPCRLHISLFASVLVRMLQM